MTPEDVRVRKGWLDRSGNGTEHERWRVHLIELGISSDRRDAELMRQLRLARFDHPGDRACPLPAILLWSVPGGGAHPMPGLSPAGNDAELGMAWWNGLTELERAHWMEVADSAIPADAWKAWKLARLT
jgi:hypothetical protein